MNFPGQISVKINKEGDFSIKRDDNLRIFHQFLVQARRTFPSPAAWRKDTGLTRPRSESSCNRRACFGTRRPRQKKGRCAEPAQRRRRGRQNPAAYRRASAPDRPSSPARTEASKITQRRQHAAQSLRIDICVDRQARAIRKSDFHHAALHSLARPPALAQRSFSPPAMTMGPAPDS